MTSPEGPARGPDRGGDGRIWEGLSAGAPAERPVRGGAGGPAPDRVQREPSAAAAAQAAGPWPGWLGPVAFLAAFIGVGLPVAVALNLVAVAEGRTIKEAADIHAVPFGLAQDLLWLVLVVALPLLVARYLRAEHLGLRRASLGRSVAIGIASFVAFLVMGAIYIAVTGVKSSDNELLQDTGFGRTVVEDVGRALLFVVVAPLVEELLFRGLIYRSIRDGLARLRGRSGVVPAAVITGVAFGAVHIGSGQDKFLPILMVFGVILALAYQWSGTLYVPIALHAINNAQTVGFSVDPTKDWVFALVAVGPVLALLAAWVIGKLIDGWLPADPPGAGSHPASAPVRL